MKRLIISLIAVSSLSMAESGESSLMKGIEKIDPIFTDAYTSIVAEVIETIHKVSMIKQRTASVTKSNQGKPHLLSQKNP